MPKGKSKGGGEQKQGSQGLSDDFAKKANVGQDEQYSCEPQISA